MLNRLLGMAVAALFPLALPLAESADPHSCQAVAPPAAVASFAFSRPTSQRALLELNAWCSAVGSAVIDSNSGEGNTGDLAVVSWNIHGDAGDLPALVERIRDGSLVGMAAARFVLLLQEVVRRGDDVPPDLASGSRMARPLPGGKSNRLALRETARVLGLDLAYVPSMRNGSDREDRGNAILSTVPIVSVDAFELPLGRQRRVVVAATIRGASVDGGPLRFVSVHLDTGLQLAAGGPARWRERQASALVELLGASAVPTVVAGDLNTWWGADEPAVRTLRRAYPEAVDRGSFARTWRGALGAGNRLDYVFARGWGRRIDVHRSHERFGSDHTPLYAWLRKTSKDETALRGPQSRERE